MQKPRANVRGFFVFVAPGLFVARGLPTANRSKRRSVDSASKLRLSRNIW
jgi:hypothetical protein